MRADGRHRTTYTPPVRRSSALPAMPGDVRRAFASFPAEARARLEEVRALLLEEAERLEVGPITETLKWNEPAYLTEATRAGTTVRLGWHRKHPEHFAVYVHCQTSVVSDVRAAFGDAFEYWDHRALLMRIDAPVPDEPLRGALARALTYHRR